MPGGTELSERRRANGADKPFDIRMWCLGNEMDGPWQLGHKSAEDYGMLAASVAAGMRQIDPDVELVGVRLLRPWHADLRQVGADRS